MLTALGALSFFTCLREPPPFAPLEPWFPLFCGTPGQGSEYIFAATKNAIQRRKVYNKDQPSSGLKDSGVTPPPLLCSAGLRERQSPLSR